jgi:hypothetical protein
VDGRTLTRLRVAFVALGVALLLPLALLVRAASARLEEQRRLKHEVVAERIFDEMERELAALLERERARSSDAYAATNTRPETWAPFVVGYFVSDRGGARVTAGDLLTAQRAAAVSSAAQLAWQAWSPAHEAPASGADSLAQGEVAAPAAKSNDELLLNPYSKQEAVLRKLNRSAQPKRRAPAPDKDKGKKIDDLLSDDPLSSMEDL